MAKVSLPKGFRDFLPSELIPRQRVIATLVSTFQRYGFEPRETPTAERIETLMGNADKGRQLVARLPKLLGADRAPCPHGCDRALEFAILTAPDARNPSVVAKLDAVAGRVL